MDSNFSIIQEYLHQRADLQARLKLLPEKYEDRDQEKIIEFMKTKCWKTF